MVCQSFADLHLVEGFLKSLTFENHLFFHRLTIEFNVEELYKIKVVLSFYFFSKYSDLRHKMQVAKKTPKVPNLILPNEYTCSLFGH